MSIDEDEIRELAAKRQAAERAVEGVAPALKEKAFEVLFRHLLETGGQSAGKAPRSPTRAKSELGAKSATKPAAKKTKKVSGPKGLITELVNDGFFDEWRSLPDIVERLRVGGHIYKQTGLSTPLRRLTQDKVLRRRERERDGGRKIWMYEKYK